jgi:hypothetical protein
MRFLRCRRAINAHRKSAKRHPIREQGALFPGTDWKAGEMRGAPAHAAKGRGRIRHALRRFSSVRGVFCSCARAAFWRTEAAP